MRQCAFITLELAVNVKDRMDGGKPSGRFMAFTATRMSAIANLKGLI